jgi:hypothetical protein
MRGRGDMMEAVDRYVTCPTYVRDPYGHLDRSAKVSRDPRVSGDTARSPLTLEERDRIRKLLDW